jgi:hypothetical protein
MNTHTHIYIYIDIYIYISQAVSSFAWQPSLRVSQALRSSHLSHVIAAATSAGQYWLLHRSGGRNTLISAHTTARTFPTWHQPRLANITYAWSWTLCGITPAIQFWHISDSKYASIRHCYQTFQAPPPPPAWPLVSISRAGQTATKKESNCKADPHNIAYNSSRWQFAAVHSWNNTKAKQDLKTLTLHFNCLGLYFRNTRYKAVRPNTVCDACN